MSFYKFKTCLGCRDRAKEKYKFKKEIRDYFVKGW